MILKKYTIQNCVWEEGVTHNTKYHLENESKQAKLEARRPFRKVCMRAVKV
jgi:hypothetical protein